MPQAPQPGARASIGASSGRFFMPKPEKNFSVGDRSRKNFTMLPNTIVRKRWPRGFKEVLLSIASHAGDGGACTASAATIGAENGIKPATVYKAIAYWRQLGVIEVNPGREGLPPEIVTTFDYTNPNYPQVCLAGHRSIVHTSAPGGTPPMPLEAHPPMPRGAHKEEYVKKRNEEESRPDGDKYIYPERKRRYGPSEGMQPIGKLLEKRRT